MTIKHRMCRSPEYLALKNAKDRCYNPKHFAYKNYGARGITICAEWLSDFMAFYNHIGPRPSDRHEIDRIDNHRGYVPGNVRWTSSKVNNRNRRTTDGRDARRYRYRGKVYALCELAELARISGALMKYRLTHGWTIASAVNTRPAKNGRRS